MIILGLIDLWGRDYGLYMGRVFKEYYFAYELNPFREYASSSLSHFLCTFLLSLEERFY